MNTEQIAGAFEQALQAAESTGEVDALVRMFSDRAELENLGAAHGLHGTQGAEGFWKRYLDQFKSIRSEFRRKIVSDSSAVLEWESQGALGDDRPISYRGVSIIEIDSEGKVSAFRTYYDSAAFVPAAATPV